MHLVCPTCKTKIEVSIDSLPEFVICPSCGKKFKVIKRLQMIAAPHNPNEERKSLYTYDLEEE